MTRNPVINGSAAALYIIFIAVFMNIGTKLVKGPDTFLAPMAMISLFTLSAAVMGYVFCYEPLQFLLDGKKKQGINLFLKTVAVFGAFTFLSLLLLFSGILPK